MYASGRSQKCKINMASERGTGRARRYLGIMGMDRLLGLASFSGLGCRGVRAQVRFGIRTGSTGQHPSYNQVISHSSSYLLSEMGM